MPSYDVVVLGAGPAGLYAAWTAARTGRSVVVVERSDRVGGLAGSFEMAGVRVDHGSHRLHPATPPDVMAALRGLLGDDLQTRPRHGRLRVWDRWVGFPLRPAELVRTLPPRVLAALARDALTAPLRRPRADTFADVLRAGLGPTLYDELYAGYARKLWGLDPVEISGEQARRRVTADSPWKLARRVLGRRRRPQGRVFHYPRRGFGQLVEALADAAVAAGADIRLESPVTAVRDGAVDADSTTYSGTVLSTLPLPVLARLGGAGEPAEGLASRAMVLAYLVHEGGRWSEYDAHYLPSPATPVTRLSEPANYRVSGDDPSDRSVLCAEVPCDVGDAVWTMPDAEVGRLVQEAIATSRLPPVRLADVQVRRVPVVYPVYRLGFEVALARLLAWLDGFERVVTLGRHGAFAHDNTHHAFVMARDAVAALGPDGRVDRVAWQQARARHARHVVED